VPGSERLVHGTIQGHPRAWVTYDVALGDMGANGGKFDYGNITMAWEPVADEYYPWVYSQNAYNAVEHHAYTMDEARQRFADSGHYGPWGEGGTR
jgi:hypothetical protein